MQPADVVLRFLESVGRRDEAEFYLRLFRQQSRERFACISVDANVARHASEAVVLDLKFLAALDLVPVVVLGLFEPTDAGEHAARIQRRLQREGVTAEPLAVGDPAAVIERAQRGTIPLLVFEAPGKNDRAEAAVDERFQRMGALLSQLATRKLIFLHRPGGLRQAGTLVPLVNLTTDFPSLSASKELSRKERAILSHSRRLVYERVEHKLLVAVTSPLNLFRELFTTKGAGTMLRRGATLERHARLSELDPGRLGALLESSFGRPPVDAFFGRQTSKIFLEESYRGVAILVETPLGSYLSKFAVDREAQGEGMGRDLWQALIAEHPSVFWRARPENPINPWYASLCDGLQRSADWTVYWKGIAPEKVPEAIAFARAQPVDIPAPGD
jgi:acetylglutamate kinase